MTIKEMYNTLVDLGGFTSRASELNKKQERFLLAMIEEDGNDIDIDDFLEIIAEYRNYDDAEINFAYYNSEELVDGILDDYNVPYFIQSFIDYERLGEVLLEDERYFELKDGRILVIEV